MSVSWGENCLPSPQPEEMSWDSSWAVWDQGKDGALKANPTGFASCWQRSRVGISNSRGWGRGRKPFSYCMVSERGSLCPGVSGDSVPSLPGQAGGWTRCPGLSRHGVTLLTQPRITLVRSPASLPPSSWNTEAVVCQRGIAKCWRPFLRWQVCMQLYVQVYMYSIPHARLWPVL